MHNTLSLGLSYRYVNLCLAIFDGVKLRNKKRVREHSFIKEGLKELPLEKPVSIQDRIGLNDPRYKETADCK